MRHIEVQLLNQALVSYAFLITLQTGWCWNFLHIEAGCLGVQNCCLRHSWWFLVGSETGCTILCKELNCLIFCGPSCIMDGLCLLRDMTSYRATMGSKLSPVRTKHMPMAKAWNFWDKDWIVGEVFITVG